MAMQARLKPYDGRRHMLQRIALSQLQGMRFEQGFWYKVTEEQADILARVNQQGEICESVDDVGVAAFDVMTYDEAEALAQLESRAVLLAAPEVRNLMQAPTRDDPGDAPMLAPAAARVGAKKPR